MGNTNESLCHERMTMKNSKCNERIIMEGYLRKQSLHLRTLRRRWVILKGHCLLTYKKPVCSETEPTETIDLTLYNDIIVGNNNAFTLISRNVKKHQDRIFTANSTENVYKWVDAINPLIISPNTAIEIVFERVKRICNNIDDEIYSKCIKDLKESWHYRAVDLIDINEDNDAHLVSKIPTILHDPLLKFITVWRKEDRFLQFEEPLHKSKNITSILNMLKEENQLNSTLMDIDILQERFKELCLLNIDKLKIYCSKCEWNSINVPQYLKVILLKKIHHQFENEELKVDIADKTLMRTAFKYNVDPTVTMEYACGLLSASLFVDKRRLMEYVQPLIDYHNKYHPILLGNVYSELMENTPKCVKFELYSMMKDMAYITINKTIDYETPQTENQICNPTDDPINDCFSLSFHSMNDLTIQQHAENKTEEYKQITAKIIEKDNHIKQLNAALFSSNSEKEQMKIELKALRAIREKYVVLAQTIHNLEVSTQQLLNSTHQFLSNEAFQKELSRNSKLITEYTTGNETNESSSTQSNHSRETKHNSDDDSGNNSNDNSPSKNNNHNDDHDENDSNNDQNHDHKLIQKYCNVSRHAQLEEENRRLKKLLLQKQTTEDDIYRNQSYDTAVHMQEHDASTNLKLTRKLWKTIIPNNTDELFCNLFDYLNKYFYIHHDKIQDYKCDDKEIKIIDYGIPCKKTKEPLYVVCEKQNKLWKANEDVYHLSTLEQIYKISKHLSFPVTINDKTCAEIKHAKEHVTRILKNKTQRNAIIGSKNTPWNNENKIPVINKSKQNGLTLILEKHQFVQKLKTFGDKNANDILLIPIVRFDNENNYFYEIAWIVEIGKDINIAISFKHIKNKYLPSAIYLDIHDAHKLVVYKHNCDCLTNFNCFIDRLQIGENKQTRMHQRYKRKTEQTINIQENQINEQKNQIDEHENQMQNYLRLREQDMLIIGDMKLTYANLQTDLQSLLKLQCDVNGQQQICNRLHEVNTLNTLQLNSQPITINPFQVYSNQLTTQFNNLNSNQQQ